MRLYDIDTSKEKWLNVLNSGDPDQRPLSVVSDLGLHCLPVTRLGVSSVQWAKVNSDGLNHTGLSLTIFPPNIPILVCPDFLKKHYYLLDSLGAPRF